MGNLSESFGLSQLFTVQADIDITLQLRQALALVDIELLDHVVVAGEKNLSLAETGHFYAP
ncbi:MAG: JAB domain-containing protein [Pseudomonadota bacterium]|nr:JAB domain-containing protein [Pseudomonadota bacterium]